MATAEEQLKAFVELLGRDEFARARLRELLRDDELRALDVRIQALAEARFARIEAALEALAEAQRRTEQRLEALAEAQRRTEQRLEALAEAQRRTEERLEALAEAQRRTEERLARVEEEMAALAEAQRRTEERLDALAEAQGRTEAALEALAEAQRRTEERIGPLLDDIGVTAEVEAQEVLLEVLERRAYAVLGEPAPVDLDGEVDLAVQVQDEGGRRLTVLVEAKNRLRSGDVAAWADRAGSEGFRARLAAAGLPGPYLVYAFGRRVYLGVREVAERAGVGVLGARGEQVAPRVSDG
jgi:multidrug efflux pump subunit AcrA (membrane-fusion protein)